MKSKYVNVCAFIQHIVCESPCSKMIEMNMSKFSVYNAHHDRKKQTTFISAIFLLVYLCSTMHAQQMNTIYFHIYTNISTVHSTFHRIYAYLKWQLKKDLHIHWIASNEQMAQIRFTLNVKIQLSTHISYIYIYMFMFHSNRNVRDRDRDSDRKTTGIDLIVECRFT